MWGSGGMIIMDETTDMVKVLLRICRFYAFESCGQCTPCREGTGWEARATRRGAASAHEKKMVKTVIDGKEYSFAEGTTILEAAKSVGIAIPHYCYHPGLSIA